MMKRRKWKARMEWKRNVLKPYQNANKKTNKKKKSETNEGGKAKEKKKKERIHRITDDYSGVDILNHPVIRISR